MIFKALPILIIAILSIGSVFEKDQQYSPQEKRELKTLDGISFDFNNIQNIPSELDKYFKDQAFLKNSLFNLYARFKLAIGGSPSEDVTLGMNNWLFLGSPASKKYANLINYRSKVFPTLSTKHYLRIKSELKSRLNTQGIDYIFVVTPDKSSIYPEYLPDQYRSFNLRRQALSDAIAVQFASELGLSFLNLKEDLIKSKKYFGKPLYHLWDTHWNFRGSSIAEAAIAERVNLKDVNSDINFDRLDFVIVKNKFYTGDLAQFTGATHLSEKILTPKPNNSLSTKCVEAALGDNSLVCRGGAEAMRILLVRDSFSTALIPFMSQRYSDLFAVWEYPSNERIQDLVKEVKPDLVIEQVVEREFLYFSGVPRNPL